MKKNTWLALWLFILAIGGFLSRYGFNLLLAKQLPAYYYGDTILGWRLLKMVGTLILIGTNVSCIRFLSHYIRHEQGQLAKAFIRWNTRVVFIVISSYVILSLVVFCVMITLNHFDVLSLYNYPIGFLMMSVTPIMALILLANGYLICCQRPIFSYFFQHMGKYLFLILGFVLATQVLQIPLTRYTIVAIFASSLMTVFIVQYLLLIPRFHIIFSTKLLTSKDLDNKYRQWLPVSAKLLVNNFLFLFICVLDLLIVKFFSFDQNNIGYYSAILAIVGILWLIPPGIYQFIKAKISSLIETQDGKQSLQTEMNHANILLLFISSGITGLLIYFSYFLLGQFGEQYTWVQTTLVIAIIATFIGSLCKPAVSLLVYSGHENQLVLASIIEIGGIILLGIPLTYTFDLVGMAVTGLIVNSLKLIALLFCVRSQVGMKALIIL